MRTWSRAWTRRRRHCAPASAPDRGWGEPAESDWGLLGTTEDAHRYPSLPGDYPAFYAGVVAALRDGAPAPVDPRDALATLDVLERARRSAAEGKTL